MPHPTMTRADADEVVSWVEGRLTVTIPLWQREVLAILMMYPDAHFEPLVSYRRG